MSVESFDGGDFFIGTVRGIRGFDVDRLGRLRGVTHDAVWTPGENIAEHRSESFARGLISLSASGIQIRGPETVTGNPQPHDFKACSHCGFYAYFADNGMYVRSAEVKAIIEGYGTVHVGSDGFRAGKARVVALVDERKRGISPARWRFYRLARRLAASRSEEWPIFAAVACLFVSPFAGGGVGQFSVSAGWMVGVAIVLLGAYLAYSSFRAISYEFSSIHPELRDPSEPAPMDRIRTNYPGVPVYRSMKAALADYPVDSPFAPEPVTPDTDPDFWTRSA